MNVAREAGASVNSNVLVVNGCTTRQDEENPGLGGFEPYQNPARSLYPSRCALTASSSNSPKELLTFLFRERFPLSGDDSIKRNVDNSDTMQGENPIPQDLAHAPNLSIASFGKNDTESRWTKSFYPAGLG